MDTALHSSNTIIFPVKKYQEMIGHCLRKLAGDYYPDEVQEPKAFGLLGGVLSGEGIEIKTCMPLMKISDWIITLLASSMRPQLWKNLADKMTL